MPRSEPIDPSKPQVLIAHPQRITFNQLRAFQDVTHGQNLTGVHPLFPTVFYTPLAKTFFRNGVVDLDRYAIVHGAEQVEVHQPLKHGDEVTARMSVERVRTREDGASPLIIRYELVRDKEIVHSVTSSYLLVPKGKPAKDKSQDFKPAGNENTMFIYRDAPMRYALVSGDDNPIHRDNGAAQAAGFKGVILHGVASAAMLTNLALKLKGLSDLSCVKKLKAKFESPVYPGFAKYSVEEQQGGLKVEGTSGHSAQTPKVATRLELGF